MILASKQVDEIHKKLGNNIKEIVPYAVKVVSQPSGNDWKLVRRDEIVAFELVSTVASASDRAHREKGEVTPVFQIYSKEGIGPAAWASWREEWKTLGNDEFEFRLASWTFYWGTALRDDIRQLFRGEWDLLVKKPGEEASQPHWHFDQEIVQIVSPKESALPVEHHDMELKELSTEPHLQELSSPMTDTRRAQILRQAEIQALHLGMGGWDKAPKAAGCWTYALEIDSLLKWASCTLRLAKSEFRRMNAFEIEVE